MTKSLHVIIVLRPRLLLIIFDKRLNTNPVKLKLYRIWYEKKIYCLYRSVSLYNSLISWCFPSCAHDVQNSFWFLEIVEINLFTLRSLTGESKLKLKDLHK